MNVIMRIVLIFFKFGSVFYKMDNQVIKILQTGGVGVLLTDTLYGLVGSALNKKTVARIYKLKYRQNHKPPIVLIASIEDLKIFGIEINNGIKESLKNIWPGPVSVILPCPYKKFEYLHRGTKTLAVRWPDKKSLINILKKTGPLVAPSANVEGLPHAKNIKEAKNYFNDEVDFYVAQSGTKNKPSRIIRIDKDGIVVLRE